MAQTKPDDAIRLRLRNMLDERKLSHTRICERLTEMTGEPWLVARFGKLLNGRIRMRVEDLVWIARAANLSLVDLVREPGREYVADMTPTELRFLAAVRATPTDKVDAILRLLELPPLKLRTPSRQLLTRKQFRAPE